MQVYFGALNSVPFVYVSVFMSVQYGLYYYSLKSGSLMPPILFFLRNTLAVWSLLWFHIHLGFFFSTSIKKCYLNLDRDCIKTIDDLVVWTFTNISYFNPWKWDIFPFMCVFFNFFINTFWFSVYSSFTSLVIFIPKYFIVFSSIVNGLFSNSSQIIYC